MPSAAGEPLAAAAPQAKRLRTAQTTYRVALGYMTVMTLIWVFLNLTGVDGGLFFKNYRVTGELLVGLAVFFLVFWVGWSWAFYRLKRHLLRKAGSTRPPSRSSSRTGSRTSSWRL